MSNDRRPSYRLVTFAVALSVAISIPLAVVAANVFSDVPDSNVFHDDIAWLADAGVTLGCNPPTNTEFCPADNVTREQMAAFMRRFAQYLGAEDGTPASADSLGGVTAAELDTAAYSTFNDGPITTDFNDRTVMTLDLPAGSYVIIAKAWLDHGSGTDALAECTLSAGADFDQARAGLDINTSVLDTATVAMTVLHEFDAPGSAVLECDELELNANLRVWDAKITAIEVTTISNVAG